MEEIKGVTVRCSLAHETKSSLHRHDAILVYTEDDPMAIVLYFVPEMIRWTLGRDLFVTAAIQGAVAGIPEGHVQVIPAHSERFGNHLVVMLDGVDDTATNEGAGVEKFIIDRRTVQKFLYATMDLVALGEEDYAAQIDEMLRELLS